MFEFAISQHRRHPPSRRLLASGVFSCLAHVALVLILLQYPELLRAGRGHWFRQPADFSSYTPPAAKEWRSVAVVGTAMEMPPAEELKKYLYNWNPPDTKAGQTPPIHVNLPRGLPDDSPVPIPKPRMEPAGVTSTPQVSLAGIGGGAALSGGAGAGEAGNRAGMAAPPPMTEPNKIPKGIGGTPPAGQGAKPDPSAVAAANPGSTPARPPGKGAAPDKPAGQQTGVRGEGNIFFDDKGFNLKDYAELVTQRVKEHWMIPSNLRNYQGNVTIIFYITKDGQVVNAKIEVLSGNDSLNLSALTAVWDSGPFPPLPRGFPSDRVGARLIFAYSERQ